MGATPAPINKKPSQEQLTKLAEGYRYVTIPKEDIYEQPFEGIWINQMHFAPGTHLVHPDIADSLEDRLKAWQSAMIRLMRPGIDRKAVEEANRRGAGVGVVGDPAPEASV